MRGLAHPVEVESSLELLQAEIFIQFLSQKQAAGRSQAQSTYQGLNLDALSNIIL